MMITLLPMDDTEFQEYLNTAIPYYAQEHVKAGRWSEEDALQRAKQEYEEILTDGLNTKNQYFFSVIDERTTTKVGLLWFALRDRGNVQTAYVYDIIIFERYRRHGYGEQAFRALETKVRALGLNTIALHVFGNNHAARAMYEKLGYIPTNLTMVKTLDFHEE